MLEHILEIIYFQIFFLSDFLITLYLPGIMCLKISLIDRLLLFHPKPSIVAFNSTEATANQFGHLIIPLLQKPLLPH